MRRTVALGLFAVVAVVAGVSCTRDASPKAVEYERFALTDEQRHQVEGATGEDRAVILSREADTVVVGIQYGQCQSAIDRLVVDGTDLVIELRKPTTPPGQTCGDQLVQTGLRASVKKPGNLQGVVLRRVSPQ